MLLSTIDAHTKHMITIIITKTNIVYMTLSFIGHGLKLHVMKNG